MFRHDRAGGQCFNPPQGFALQYIRPLPLRRQLSTPLSEFPCAGTQSLPPCARSGSPNRRSDGGLSRLSPSVGRRVRGLSRVCLRRVGRQGDETRQVSSGALNPDIVPRLILARIASEVRPSTRAASATDSSVCRGSAGVASPVALGSVPGLSLSCHHALITLRKNGCKWSTEGI
jgi:hypothetical protein